MANKVCSLAFCDKPHYGNGYCVGHNAQFKRGKELQPFGFYIHGKSGKRSERVPIQLGDLGYIPLSDEEDPEYAIIDWEDASIAAQYTWSKSKRGYAEARALGTVNGKVLLHQLVFPTDGEIDHKNRDTLDNRKSNLRTATRSQQLSNSTRFNKTGYRGVYERENGKFSARVNFNKVKYYVGTFDTAEEAALARDEIALKVQGEFAVLNFNKYLNR